jgi:acyl-coenzyme A thioesterase PaaI-like protein
MDIARLQQVFAPLFPGLLGMQLQELTASASSRRSSSSRIFARPATRCGSALMAFADTLGAVGTFMNMPKARTTTVDSSTKFIGGAPVGTTITGECTPFHRGRDHGLADADQGRIGQALRGRHANAAHHGA